MNPPRADRAGPDCSEVSDVSAVVGGTTFFKAAAAPVWAETTGMAVSDADGAPSKANAAPAIGAAPKINAKIIRSHIRITLFLVRAAWMGYGPIHRRPNLLGILPQRA